nr:hypothetical protein [Prescottella equi]
MPPGRVQRRTERAAVAVGRETRRELGGGGFPLRDLVELRDPDGRRSIGCARRPVVVQHRGGGDRRRVRPESAPGHVHDVGRLPSALVGVGQGDQ